MRPTGSEIIRLLTTMTTLAYTFKVVSIEYETHPGETVEAYCHIGFSFCGIVVQIQIQNYYLKHP